MKVVRILALILLGLLLVVSLSVFALAFTLNSTALNPGFYDREMDKIDAVALIEEPVNDWTAEEGLSAEFRAALLDGAARVEPLVKEQLAAGIKPVLDYLNGKSQTLDLARVLGDRVVTTDFIVSAVDRVDLPTLAGEVLGESIAEEVSLDKSELKAYVKEVLTEAEPWLREQVRVVAGPVKDYLLGESQTLNVIISLQPLTDALKAVPELRPYIGDIEEAMPVTFEIDESMVGPEMRQDIAQGLADAEQTLADVKQAIGYFHLGYWILIGLIVLLAAGYALVSWQVRRASRGLGIIFLSSGAVFFAGYLVTKGVVGRLITQQPDMPAAIQQQLPVLLSDSLFPLALYAIILLVLGAALLAVSFIVKPKEAQA